jgi:lipoate---protein ligase
MLRLIVDLAPRDPSLGLALEEALLETAKLQNTCTLRLWVNDRSVIIGRSQSVASEVNQRILRAKSIPVLRRLSGGGAVYHYRGNLNLSAFLTSTHTLSNMSQTYAAFAHIFARMLSQLGVKAESSRNSILIGKKKIAGAAQVRSKGLVLYHTTFMVTPPLIPIDSLLLAMQKDYRTSFVASHPLPITSLAQVVPGITMRALIDPLSDGVARLVRRALQEDTYSKRELDRAKILQQERYGNDRWNLSR